DRQLDVLALMMQGKNNKSICRMLNLAEPTVKNHVTAILKAMKVTNRTEAVIAVNELGWKLPATPTLRGARSERRDSCPSRRPHAPSPGSENVGASDRSAGW